MNFDLSDMPFPIERCSKRVANALLREFEGRIPTVEEVLAYRDNDWLGTPGFGRKALEEINEIKSSLQPAPAAILRAKISDAELVLHLHGLVQDMEAIIGKISQRNGVTSVNQQNGQTSIAPPQDHVADNQLEAFQIPRR